MCIYQSPKWRTLYYTSEGTCVDCTNIGTQYFGHQIICSQTCLKNSLKGLKKCGLKTGGILTLVNVSEKCAFDWSLKGWSLNSVGLRIGSTV